MRHTPVTITGHTRITITGHTRDILLECGRASDLRIIPVQSDFYCQATQFNNSRTNRIVGDMFFRTLHFWCTSAYSLKS